jgi:hypothetical protein
MRKGTLSFVLILSIGMAVITFVGLPITTDAADPEDRGSLITHYDPELKHLVVLDPGRGQLAVYDVRSEARVLGVRNLNRDLEADAATPVEAMLPENDVPGEDPPGFTRLKGSIRVRSGFETRWQGAKSGIQSGNFSVREGTDSFEMTVRPSTQFPGWVWVRVNLDRKTG